MKIYALIVEFILFSPSISASVSALWTMPFSHCFQSQQVWSQQKTIIRVQMSIIHWLLNLNWSYICYKFTKNSFIKRKYANHYLFDAELQIGYKQFHFVLDFLVYRFYLHFYLIFYIVLIIKSKFGLGLQNINSSDGIDCLMWWMWKGILLDNVTIV